jgi:glycine/D-amino acid oxidase-like deaminating enzyme
MVDISVVGAGVVGAAVAYRLAEAGARVTVLEAAAISASFSPSSRAEH